MPTPPSSSPAPLMVAIFAVSLGLVHISEASANRAAVLNGIAAANASAQAQAMAVRETVLMASGNIPGLDPDVRGNRLGEALQIRQGNAHAPGINQLQASARVAAQNAADAAARAKGDGLAQGALQLAILLLAVSMLMGDRRVMLGGGVLGGIGIVLAVLSALGMIG